VVRFTKYEHFFVIARHFIAQEIAQLFLDHVYKFHGLSVTIFTDTDKILTGIFWKGLFKLLGVQLLMSSSYYSRTDGEIKRVNRCLKTHLRCMIIHSSSKWHDWLFQAQWLYDFSFHSAIKMTPFQALMVFLLLTEN
jgi:hypothetical protein